MSSLADIRAREAAATPGPWRWYGNTDTQEIALTTRGMGTSYVMRFARWGMRNAKPLFAEGRKWGPDPDYPDRFEIRPHGRMTGVEAMPVYEVAPTATDRSDPRVYRADLIGIRHPDAIFIEHAREDVARLLAVVDDLRAQLAAKPGQMLREFHAAKAIHGGLMPDRPTADVPEDVRDLRIALLDEEVEELRKAMLEGDIIGIADGIADVLFVAYGTAVPYGIPADEVFAEVHRSNMTKTNETPEAKLTKGPGYERPDIARALGLAGENADA